jgi:hypothetical protein
VAAKAHMDDADLHSSVAEHTKLAGIEAGAEVNQNAFSQVNDIEADDPEDALTVAGGIGITVTTNPATKTLTVTATGEAAPGAHASTHIEGGSDPISLAVAGGSSGLMSGADATFVRSTGETKTGAQAKADAAAALSVPLVQKGVAGGVATLGTTARLLDAQLPVNVPLQTTADITYYVRTDGNDANTGLANTAAGAFETIGKAISMIPRVVNHPVIVNVAAGTYAEKVTIAGFSGSNNITLQGATTATATHMINGLDAYYNAIHVNVTGFTGTRTDAAPFNAVATQEIFFYRCLVTASSASYAFNADEGAMMYVGQCVISNRGVAIYAQVEGRIFTSDLSGTNNIVGYRAYFGGKITITGTQVSSTNGNESQYGGQIMTGVGVINPWGDNTTSQRSSLLQYATADQAISGNVYTKINFPTALYTDNLGEWSLGSRFTAKGAYGRYIFNWLVGFN